MEWLKYLDLLKLPTKYFLSISIISGTLLFNPAQILDYLGLQEFRETNKNTIGLVFLISTGILLTQLIILILN